MEINITGTNLDLSDRFKEIANDKCDKIIKLASNAISAKIEVTEKKNPSEKDHSHKVEIIVTGPNTSVHAEARAEDHYSALDLAMEKIEAQLRKAHDKASNHRR